MGRSVALCCGALGAQLIQYPASGAFDIETDVQGIRQFFITISASDFFQDKRLVLGFGRRRDGDGPRPNAGKVSGRRLTLVALTPW